MGSSAVEGRPQHEQHLDLLEKFSQSKRQLEQLLDTNDLAQLDGKLQELQAIITEVASHLPAASLRWVQEQFAALRSRVDEVQEKLKPRKRFAFKSARGSVASSGSDAKLEGIREPGPSFPAGTVKNACTVGFQRKSGETLMLSEVGGKDTELDSLDDCQVTVQGCPATMFARRLRNCHIQLRIHDSHKCEFQVHVQTRSIIEDSKELLFSKYDFAYDGDEQDWCASHLDRTVNNWDKVDDFNWLVADKPSPNWKLSEA
ncbi:hypothetical protein MRX96_003641 [Rhipicephalus microplus]